MKKEAKSAQKAKKKNKKEIKYVIKPFKERASFAFQPRFYLYLFIWIFSMIFTQALHSSISSVLFAFVSIFPFALLAYVFILKSSVEANVENSVSQCSKLENVTFDVKVENTSAFLPAPFVEADLLVPDKNCLRCTEQRFFLALAQKSKYDISNTVSFYYRGEYKIGVKNIYVYDLLKLFRLKKEVNIYNPVLVLPRKLILPSQGERAASDVNTDSQVNSTGVDIAEMNDIRQYRAGDHMKTVHWKLSTKTEELQVKQYAMNTGNTTYIFVDLAKHYNTKHALDEEELYNEDINEYCADGVVEIAIAAALRTLKRGDSVKLIWYDSRTKTGANELYLESPADLDRNFSAFAMSGLVSIDNDVTRLVSLVKETQGVSLIFVTPCINSKLVDGMSVASSMLNNVSSAGAVEIYYFNPSEKIKNIAEKYRVKESSDACRGQLVQNGIVVEEIRLD